MDTDRHIAEFAIAYASDDAWYSGVLAGIYRRLKGILIFFFSF